MRYENVKTTKGGQPIGKKERTYMLRQDMKFDTAEVKKANEKVEKLAHPFKALRAKFPKVR